MTWSKLSDDFSDDCWTLSDVGFRLHVEGLVWSNRKLLDLRLPKVEVQRFAKHPEAVTELLQLGWWSDEGDVYVIRHHGLYQRLREDVLKQQEANRTNGRKGGRPPKPAREQALSSETQSVSESVSKRVSGSVTPPASRSSRQRVPSERAETQSVSDSPSESKSERDRTGLVLENGTNNESGWPPVAVRGGCSVCHQPLVSVDGSTTHPTCDPLEAIA